MEATLIDGLVAHCQSGRFTGILRVRAREGIGEIWFLSGITDEMQFGTSTADEAMDRIRKATEATYELVARLPHPAGGFKRRFPSKGSIATATPVTLMRYCERYALTCTLAVESHDMLVEAKYVLGDLVAVETTADDDGITTMLEAEVGTYDFTLPRVELPAGTPVLPPAPSLMESMPPPESLGFRALLETKVTIGRPASDEAEVKRKTVEIARQQRSETRRAVPRPASKPVPITEKRDAEKGEEAKPAAAPSEPVEKEEVKPAAAPSEPVEKEDEERESEPAQMPPAKASLTWFVVPLLFAAGLIYLLWTNRI
jgi:hypothetical protein